MSTCQGCCQFLEHMLVRRDDSMPRRRHGHGRDHRLGQPTHDGFLPRSLQKVYEYRQRCWLCCHVWTLLLLNGPASSTGRLTDEAGGQLIQRYHKDAQIGLLANLSGKSKAGVYAMQLRLESIELATDFAHESVHFELVKPSRYSLRGGISSLWKAAKGDTKGRKQRALQQAAAAARVHNDREDTRRLQPHCIDLIQKWLNRCAGHAYCRANASRSHGTLPRRLLKICKGSKRVLLVNTADCYDVISLRYATLSHCWGKEVFEKLSVRNYQEAKTQGIAVSRFGRTFQEAIALCRDLAIEYLWVDSWCIIQDSAGNADWNEEAPQMCNIYSGSYLNIAATSSRTCAEGLLRSYRSALYSESKVQLSNGLHRFKTETNDIPCRIFNTSPLLTRGWIIQELFLSARTLHMTDTGMLWLCTTDAFYEDDVSVAKTGTMTCNYSVDKYELMAGLPDRADELWRVLAEDYSRTNFTIREDRVVALAGLVEWFKNSYHRDLTIKGPVRHLAGCWQHALDLQMLWRPQYVSRPANTRLRYEFISSWSWLSYPGTVAMMRPESPFVGEESRLRILDAEVAPTDIHRGSGLVRSACLRIEAPTFEVSEMTEVGAGDVVLRPRLVRFFDGVCKLQIPGEGDESPHQQLDFVPDYDSVGASEVFKPMRIRCAVVRAGGCRYFQALLLRARACRRSGEMVYERLGLLCSVVSRQQEMAIERLIDSNMTSMKEFFLI